METEQKKPTVVPLLLENYLNMAKASIGSAMFRNFYCLVNGERKDILEDGDLSCAFFVSWILMPFGFLKEPHATVSGTVKDMEASGWIAITEPKPGAVIVWKPYEIAGTSHAHIGIYLGKDLAVSNDYQKRSPQIHAWDKRPIEKILWHPKLGIEDPSEFA